MYVDVEDALCTTNTVDSNTKYSHRTFESEVFELEQTSNK